MLSDILDFVLRLSSATHLKQPERMGWEAKVLWFFPHTYVFRIHFYRWEIKTHCQYSTIKASHNYSQTSQIE